MRVRATWYFAAGILIYALAALVRLSFWDGGFDAPAFLIDGVRGIFSDGGDPTAAFIIEYRFGRLVSATIIGVGLALSGALLQALLRNPLASPGVLGVTSGAGLGVVVAMLVGSVVLGGAVTRPSISAAFIGAVTSLLVVYLLGRRRGVVEPLTLLLAGVIVSMLCGAMVVGIYHMLPDQGMAAAMRWMMGSIIDGAPMTHRVVAGVVVCAGLGVGLALSPTLDAATLSDDEAHGLGVNLPRLRLIVFLACGAMTSVTVLLAGPVGFVGLICPHIVRLTVGPRHAALIPNAAVTGAVIVVGGDIVSVATAPLLPGGAAPIGVLMALIGGPFFLILLRRAAPGGAFA